MYWWFMKKSFKCRIYPTKEQEELFAKTFGCKRFVYNYLLNNNIEQMKKQELIIY